MARATKSDSQEAARSDKHDEEEAGTKQEEWKKLVEDGNAAFERERYAIAEINFKSALELAEKLVEVHSKEHDGQDKTASSPPKKTKASTKSKSDKSPLEDEETARVRLTKSLNNLAALYHVQGKYGMAEELYEKCLDLKLAMYGEEHLEVAVNLHNLAVLHSAKRTFAKAELLYNRAIEIREKLLGAEHGDLLPVLKNYALLLKKTNRKDEGSKVDERAAAIEVKLSAEKAPG